MRREPRQTFATYLSRHLEKALERFNESPSSYRIGITIALLLVLGLIFAVVDLTPDLSHVRVTVLSGPENGQDYALVEELARGVKQQNGTVVNVATEGTTANFQRLDKAADSGGTLFALAPDGLRYPTPERLALVARLPRSKTLFMLGPRADAFRYPSDLAGLHLGIGPPDSATALLAREIFGSELLKELLVTVSEHPFAEQIDLLDQGQLDLGLFLMDAEAPLIEQAVRGGLQIAGFDNAEALAARVPALKIDTLYAGHFDQLRRLPHNDKKVLQTDLLMLSNAEASRSQAVAMLVLLDRAYKGFVGVNRDTPNNTGLREVTELKAFVQNGGPSLMDEYAPRLVDLMPTPNILHYLVVVSLLFNATVLWHRFRLWRIDTKRLKLKERLLDFFGRQYTVEEIAELEPQPGDFTARKKEILNELIGEFELLRPWIHRLSVSFIVPLGAEIYYRQQERMVDDTLRSLRRLRARLKG